MGLVLETEAEGAAREGKVGTRWMKRRAWSGTSTALCCMRICARTSGI